jgi:hypothetical protein
MNIFEIESHINKTRIEFLKDEEQQLRELLRINIKSQNKILKDKNTTIPIAVIKYDLKGKIVKMYNSISEAARKEKNSPSYIKRRIKKGKKVKSTDKFIWKYA